MNAVILARRCIRCGNPEYVDLDAGLRGCDCKWIENKKSGALKKVCRSSFISARERTRTSTPCGTGPQPAAYASSATRAISNGNYIWIEVIVNDINIDCHSEARSAEESLPMMIMLSVRAEILRTLRVLRMTLQLSRLSSYLNHVQ
jgi:hypothetical protein